jgi:hypothetical protein
MKNLTFMLVLMFAATISAQVQQSALTIRTFANANDAFAETAFLQTTQQDRLSLIPQRVIATGGGDDVVYLLIHQTTELDEPTLSGFATAHPACSGSTISNYVIQSFTSYALASLFRGSLILKDCAYGPLAAPNGKYLVIYQNLCTPSC